MIKKLSPLTTIPNLISLNCFRCIFILPEDLHTISATTVPYELDVDIIKDCSNFRNEVREVLDVIDRDDDKYALMIEKVKVLLQSGSLVAPRIKLEFIPTVRPISQCPSASLRIWK